MLILAPEAILDSIPYAATFIFEVHKLKDELYIKTLYNQQPLILQTCKGKALCPFKDWLKLIKQKLIINDDKLYSECNKKLTNNDY